MERGTTGTSKTRARPAVALLAGSCHTQTKISLTVDIFPVCFVLKPTETGCETDRKYIDNQDPRQD